MPYQSKKKYRIKPIPVLVLILIIVMLCFTLLLINRVKGGYFEKDGTVSKPSSALNSSSGNNQDTTGDDTPATAGITIVKATEIKNSYDDAVVTAPVENDSLWNLILLNPGNGISDEIPMERIKIGTQEIDKRIESAYKTMYEDAKKAGINLFLRSGYRTLALQKSYYDANIANYISQGNSEQKAIELTRAYYTVPGHSEHHSGIAADIITDEYQRDVTTLDERFAKTPAYEWLIENCANYGFILRYPKDKTDITKISFESWHYRYVGIPHAKAIMSAGVCLEEYIESMKLSYQQSQTQTSYEAFAEEFAKVYK